MTDTHNTEAAQESRRLAIIRVTMIGFGANLILFVAKLAAGIFGRSSAMVADAIHSLSDFATDVIVIMFVNLSSKPRDESHDYGHGKYETLATVIIGLALMAVAAVLCINGCTAVWDFAHDRHIDRPESIAVAAALVSIVAKEALYRYTAARGRSLSSTAVTANALHHRSDALSSVGTLAGIGMAHFMGESWIVLDPIASIIVSILIAISAIEMLIPNLNELLEKSLPRETEDEIVSIIMQDRQIQNCHNLKTRKIGSTFAIDAHIRVDGSMTVDESHRITEEVERRLRSQYGSQTLVGIHVEPLKASHATRHEQI